jgi:hypothetical protein
MVWLLAPSPYAGQATAAALTGSDSREARCPRSEKREIVMCSVRQASEPILWDAAMPLYIPASWRPRDRAANDNGSVDIVLRIIVAIGQVSVGLGSLSLLSAIALQMAR